MVWNKHTKARQEEAYLKSDTDGFNVSLGGVFPYIDRNSL